MIQVGRESPIYLWNAQLNWCLQLSRVPKNSFSFATHEWRCRNSNTMVHFIYLGTQLSQKDWLIYEKPGIRLDVWSGI
jgi:hypothetical protein